MNQEKIILDIENLIVEYHTYKKVVCAVNGINLKIMSGETMGLVGETGAGKTTIAKSIMGILPEPQAKIRSGKIDFQGEDMLLLPEKRKRKIRGKNISMIFQDPMTALNPIEKIGDQIAETVRMHEKLTRAEAQKRAVDILETVGLPGDRYNEYPHQFSGGMKQRVIIAIAMACSPELLLADEPTTALDVTIQAQVLSIMAKLKKEFGMSVLMITHDLGIVAEMCDKVSVIYAGEIVETGTVEAVFDHTSHPYTRGLFNSLPNLNSKERRLNPIKGLMPDPTKLPEGCKFNERCLLADDNCRKCSPDMVEVTPGHLVKCYKAMEGN